MTNRGFTEFTWLFTAFYWIQSSWEAISGRPNLDMESIPLGEILQLCSVLHLTFELQKCLWPFIKWKRYFNCFFSRPQMVIFIALTTESWLCWTIDLLKCFYVFNFVTNIWTCFCLFGSIGEACWWTIHPASKQRSEGEKVRIGDDLILVSVSTERYLVGQVQRLLSTIDPFKLTCN